MNTIARQLGQSLRHAGKALDKFGVSLQGEYAYVEKLVPSTRFVEAAGKAPVAAASSFVSSSSSLVGDVKVGEESAVWYGSVVKGDSGGVVEIGRHSQVFDNSMVEAAASKPVKIGDGVLVVSLFAAQLHRSDRTRRLLDNVLTNFFRSPFLSLRLLYSDRDRAPAPLSVPGALWRTARPSARG